MDINLNRVKNISGPVALVSLEGKIDGKEKKIVLFGDYHYPMIDQNECTDYDSITIKQFLINTFKKATKPIDFFLEISPSMFESVKKEGKAYTDIYLNNLRYFFVNEMNKPTFKNIKFHYSDIRNIVYTILHDFILDNRVLSDITRSRNIYVSEIDFLVDKANVISDSINIIIFALKSTQNEFEIEIKKATEEKAFYMKNIRKIIFDYNHTEVQKEIRKILKLIIVGIKETMQSLIKELNKIKTRINKNKKYSFYELDKVIYKLGTDIRNSTTMTSGFFTMLTDLYTIRRMLDKDYVENSIFYGGAQHMSDILNILVNNFNFKVIDKFSQDPLFLKMDRQYIEKYYKVYNQDLDKESSFTVLNQCVDVSKFTQPII